MADDKPTPPPPAPKPLPKRVRRGPQIEADPSNPKYDKPKTFGKGWNW